MLQYRDSEEPVDGRGEGGPPVLILIGRARDGVREALETVADRAIIVTTPTTGIARSWLANLGGDDRLEVPELPVRVGSLEINLRDHRARWRGRRLPVTETELRILALLAHEPGRARSFAEVHEGAWRSPYLGDAGTVWSAVKRLRRKLAAVGIGFRIESVRGSGSGCRGAGNDPALWHARAGC